MDKERRTKKNIRKRKNKQKNKLVKKLCSLKIEDPKISQIGYLSELDRKTIDQQNKLAFEFSSKIKSPDIIKIFDEYKNELFSHPTSFILNILRKIYYNENKPSNLNYENINYANWLKNDLVTELIFKKRFGDDYFNARLWCYIVGYNSILSLSQEAYIDGYLFN